MDTLTNVLKKEECIEMEECNAEFQINKTEMSEDPLKLEPSSSFDDIKKEECIDEMEECNAEFHIIKTEMSEDPLKLEPPTSFDVKKEECTDEMEECNAEFQIIKTEMSEDPLKLETSSSFDNIPIKQEPELNLDIDTLSNDSGAETGNEAAGIVNNSANEKGNIVKHLSVKDIPDREMRFKNESNVLSRIECIIKSPTVQHTTNITSCTTLENYNLNPIEKKTIHSMSFEKGRI